MRLTITGWELLVGIRYALTVYYRYTTPLGYCNNIAL